MNAAPPLPTPVLLSVRPAFSVQILNGTKTVEFRRRASTRLEGRPAVLYETGPTFAIVGITSVHRVVVGTPQSLWSTYQAVGGIQAPAFHQYFKGVEKGFALELGPVTPLAPIELKTLRELLPGFVVPQSYRFLLEQEWACLGPTPAAAVGNDA